MKDFVLSNGRKLIDVAAILSIVVLLIMSIGLMTQNFFFGLAYLVMGVIGFFVMFFMVYLFIDIRDSLKTLIDQKSSN